MNEVPKWRAQYLAPRSVAWQQETPSPATSIQETLAGRRKDCCARAPSENEQKKQKVELTMKTDFYFIFYTRREIL